MIARDCGADEGRLVYRKTPAAEPVSTDEGFRAVLGIGAFRRLWLAQTVSQTAQNVIWWALFVQIARLTGGAPIGIGAIILMVQLPTILFAGLSGVLVDRVSKRTILAGSNAVRALGCLGYILWQDQATALLAITFVVSVINQPFQPAESATIPLLVRERGLLAANALFQITMMLAQILGFTVGPLLIGFAGFAATLSVGSVCLAVAALALMGLPASTAERRPRASGSIGQTARGMWAEMAEVARLVLKDTPLAVALVQLSLAPAVLLILSELGPRYVQQLLHTGQANSMILLIAPAGAGLGLGLFVIDRAGSRLPHARLATAALFAMAGAIFALALVPDLTGFLLNSSIHLGRTVGGALITVPICFVLGLATALLNAPAQTVVQQRAGSALRGRVLAVQQALAAAVAMPPLLAVAAVGQVLTVPQTLGILAAVLLVAALASRHAARHG